jgi:D-alanyl-lipoteichoic acid acyltransferase DltB (MBOAT superfamily)
MDWESLFPPVMVFLVTMLVIMWQVPKNDKRKEAKALLFGVPISGVLTAVYYYFTFGTYLLTAFGIALLFGIISAIHTLVGKKDPLNMRDKL